MEGNPYYGLDSDTVARVLRVEGEESSETCVGDDVEAGRLKNFHGPTFLLVDGIDGEVSMAELKRVFKPYGRVLEIAIVGSRVDGSHSLISASVMMQDAEAARNAARELDGLNLRGLEIRVSVVGKER